MQNSHHNKISQQGETTEVPGKYYDEIKFRLIFKGLVKHKQCQVLLAKGLGTNRNTNFKKTQNETEVEDSVE